MADDAEDGLEALPAACSLTTAVAVSAGDPWQRISPERPIPLLFEIDRGKVVNFGSPKGTPMLRPCLFVLASVMTALPVSAQLDKRFEQQQEARRQEAIKKEEKNRVCLSLAPKLSWVSIGSGWKDYYNANGYHITSTGKIYSIQVENVANNCYMHFLGILGKESGGILYKIKDRKLFRYQEYLFGEVRATVVAKRVDP